MGAYILYFVRSIGGWKCLKGGWVGHCQLCKCSGVFGSWLFWWLGYGVEGCGTCVGVGVGEVWVLEIAIVWKLHCAYPCVVGPWHKDV